MNPPVPSKMNALVRDVEAWASARGLIPGDPTAQIEKVGEEIFETVKAMLRKDQPSIVDGIGDSLVTLIVLAKQLGTNAEECLEAAYSEIKNRKGVIIDGSFIREK